jgi:hypothetical protein
MDKFEWWPFWKWWKLPEEELPQDPIWKTWDKKIVPILAIGLLILALSRSE